VADLAINRSPGHAAVSRRRHATFNGYGSDHREAAGGGGWVTLNEPIPTYLLQNVN